MRPDWWLIPMLSFTGRWLDACAQANAASRATFEALALYYDPRRLRGLWLTDLSQAADRFLRSPAFLGLLEHHGQTRARRPSFPQP